MAKFILYNSKWHSRCSCWCSYYGIIRRIDIIKFCNLLADCIWPWQPRKHTSYFMNILSHYLRQLLFFIKKEVNKTIKITEIRTIINDKESSDYYKDNKPISVKEFNSLILRKCYYEMREVYYQKEGLNIRRILLVKGDNDDDN